MRVFVAGEGPHDIGQYAQDPAYRGGATSFVEALLSACSPGAGWRVVEGRKWAKIPKYRAGDHRSAEHRNVLGALALARQAECEVLVLLRDDDHVAGRADDLRRGVAARRDDDPQVICGVPVRTSDAWCLAILGVPKSERQTDPKATLATRGVRTAAERVALVEERGLDNVPDDAVSLRNFSAQAARVGSPGS